MHTPPQVPVLCGMESAGILVDGAALQAQMGPLEQRLAQLRTKIENATGQVFNLDAPQQVSQVLFGDLKLPAPPNAKKLKCGLPSTSADVLQVGGTLL